MVIEEEVTVADIDECIINVNAMLKVDTFGNRMDWRKRETLMSSLDDLLDARNNLVKTGSPIANE